MASTSELVETAAELSSEIDHRLLSFADKRRSVSSELECQNMLSAVVLHIAETASQQHHPNRQDEVIDDSKHQHVIDPAGRRTPSSPTASDASLSTKRSFREKGSGVQRSDSPQQRTPVAAPPLIGAAVSPENAATSIDDTIGQTDAALRALESLDEYMAACKDEEDRRRRMLPSLGVATLTRAAESPETALRREDSIRRGGRREAPNVKEQLGTPVQLVRRRKTTFVEM